MEEYTPVEREILTQLQRGIEPVPRPFRAWGIPEADVLALLRRVEEEGLLRRFGGVFDARRLGYKSILCALDVPDEQIEGKALMIAAHPGVTHCYERRPLLGNPSYPPLWFTLAMLHDEFDQGLAALRAQLETRPTLNSKRETRNPKLETRNSQLFELPALRRFKIDVVFDLQTLGRDETFPGMDPPHVSREESFRALSAEEKELVRALDQQLPLVEQPFAAVAEQIGQSEEWVLMTLNGWKEQGVLRRVGAILYHREAGFKTNAMCVWALGEEAVLEAGRRLAARPEVTHCYQRPRLGAFPFDLYAMIHAGSPDRIRGMFEEISRDCGLSGGELFISGREFKKNSMRYFR